MSSNQPTGHSPSTSTTAISTDSQLETSSEGIADPLRVATRRIAPLWQLENFVAVNPYLGLTGMHFSDAATRLAAVVGARSTLSAQFYLDAVADGRVTREDLVSAMADSGAGADVDSLLDRVAHLPTVQGPSISTVAEVAAHVTGVDWGAFMVDRLGSWAATYFDGGQAMWSSERAQGAFVSWQFEASIDRTPAVMGLSAFRRHVQEFGTAAQRAAATALDQLGVPLDGCELYLHALLLRMAGWSAYAARVVWDAERRGAQDDTLVELLAVLVCWEAALLRSVGSSEVEAAWADQLDDLTTIGAAGPPAALADLLVLQDAFDRSTQRSLVADIHEGRVATDSASTRAAPRRPQAQAVFCIDVRSEVFRRHLESVASDIETLGFAGFFGIALEYRPLAHDEGVDQCPVLLTPGHIVGETIVDDALRDAAVQRRGVAHQVRRAWKSFKMGAISCFSFVGPVGLIYLPKLFADGFGRTRPVRRPESEGLDTTMVDGLQPDLGPVDGVTGSGIPGDDRVDLAEGVLRAMSLTTGFAPVVLIVGHGASTVNNPYDNGLDCGACGGHTGEVNARITAMILNDPCVRAGLLSRGVELPDDTRFVAALHDTTTDRVKLFDPESLPEAHRHMLELIDSDLQRAGHLARAERAERLGIAASSDVDAQVVARSVDWAQVRPEWGLAGCSAFIAAPRSRTAGIDLAGRAFLHSYDWKADEGFGILELIMTAPMVVASWISLQYYGSTVDNRLFGSGNKTLHNVVGRVGVLEGTGGDLRTGLPWQSVHDGTRYQHEPVRLNVMIEAPTEAINVVISRHDDVRELVDNKWIHLMGMDDLGRVAHRYAGQLRWEACS